ncbi:MAG: hypothetical protein JNG84_11885 [Archangium sp.]|nr:hypothetical protein [Archangium sp.]
MIRSSVVGVLCLYASAHAQTAAAPAEEEVKIRKTTADEIKAKLLDVKGMSETAKIPNADKIRTSADAITRMRSDLKDVLAKLEEARGSKDVVKLTCVNEKNTQIKGLLRISEAADVALQEAVARNESGEAAHEYTKVTIAQTKVQQLRAEAEQCMGQLAFRVDEDMNVEVVTPDYLPKYDPTLLGDTRTLNTLRQPPASPTMSNP